MGRYEQKEIKELNIYYDVACRYSAHAKKYKVLDEALLQKTKFMVGKFHIYAHGNICREMFNSANKAGVGLIDGEGCERVWSHVGLFFKKFRQHFELELHQFDLCF
jgi:hypothetical protein